MEYISINNLSYAYGGEKHKALNNINLTVEKGEILLICGKSGSGKSTLGKCISGSIPNFYGGTIEGKISISGIPFETLKHYERAKEVTMVFQDPEKGIMMNKVHREVAFGLENVGIEATQIKRRVWEALEFLGITEIAKKEINKLSGGEKQKVAIASALSYLPNCIIFDEPISQLDPTSSEEVINILSKINKELGITIIIIEQRVQKVFEICDKFLVLENGKVAFYGEKDEFLKRDDLIQFMPEYTKLFKNLKLPIPQNIKDARKILRKIEFEEKAKNPILDLKETAIKIKNMGCQYENVNVLEKINLNIKDGEFLGVIGANGAGKSTLLKSIVGLVKYSGSIKIFENEIKKLNMKDICKIVGYVSQNPSDYISKDTVYEELAFTLNNYGITNEKVIDEVLEMLEIAHIRDKNPRDVSGGEKQRVALASILVLKPKILLLDEPTRGLDSEIKKSLGKFLKILNKSGTTIIMVTHDIDFAAECCNNILTMIKGEIIGYGSKEEVLHNGIFYTTTINKLFRERKLNILTLEQALEGAKND